MKATQQKPISLGVDEELEKKAWAEFQKTLDDYIGQYSEAIRKFLKTRTKPSALPSAHAGGPSRRGPGKIPKNRQ